MEKKSGLTRQLKTFFGVGDLAFTLMTQVENVFFNFYLTNVAMFALPVVTIIQSVTTIVDAATSWVYGAIMNGTKPMRWGRYRSWLLITPWLVPITYMFKYIKVSENVVPAAVVITAAGIISSIIWNFGYVANMAIIPIVGRTPEDRAQLSATRGLYNRVGSMLFSYMGLPLANVLALLVTENYKFAALAFVLSILMAIGYNIHFKLTEGYEETREDTKGAVPKKEKTSVKAMLSGLFKNRHLLVLLLAELARWIANFVISGCAVYYFDYVANKPGLLATYLLCANLMCMLGAYTCKYLVKLLNTKAAFVLSYIILGGCLVLSKVFYTSPIAVIVLMSIGQYGYGSIYSLSPTMFADTAIYAEYSTGEDASGWIMGLNNVPLKVALVMRSLIINGVLASVGFSATLSADAVTGVLKNGIANAFMFIPGVCVLAGAVILIFGYGLTKDKVQMMSDTVEKRRNAQ